MPIANIIPTNYPLTFLKRSLDKATVTMFHEEDLRLDIEDFKIAVAHNGTDHYVGTKPVQKNFKRWYFSLFQLFTRGSNNRRFASAMYKR